MRSNTSTAYGVYYYRILSTKTKTSKAAFSTTPESNKKNTPPNILLASQFTPEKCRELPRLSPGNQLWIWVYQLFRGTNPGGEKKVSRISTANSQQPKSPSWPCNLVDINWNACRRSRNLTLSSAYPQAAPDPEDLTTFAKSWVRPKGRYIFRLIGIPENCADKLGVQGGPMG